MDTNVFEEPDGEDEGIPRFTQQRYFKTKQYLDGETYTDLVCEFGLIKEILECIEYVTGERADDNGRTVGVNPLNWEYAKYFMACQTAKYLADYTLRILDRLESNFVCK